MHDIIIALSFKQAQEIINNHIEYRRQERQEDPTRFDKKPTLGELAPRKAPVGATREDTELSQGPLLQKNKSSSSKHGQITFKSQSVYSLCKHVVSLQICQHFESVHFSNNRIAYSLFCAVK